MPTAHTTTTTALPDGFIELVTSTLYQGRREILARKLIDTDEPDFRAALIELGWTPPQVAA